MATRKKATVTSGAPQATVDALIAYGYTEEPAGTFTKYAKGGRPVSQQWVWKGDHWERYELGKPGYDVAEGYTHLEAHIWKNVLRQRYPHSYRDEMAPSRRYEHPERWNWDWPDEDVRKAYYRGAA